MAAIWRNDGDGWRLDAPVDFEKEAALHDVVEQAPQTLPLSGNPSISILGREVRLGNGYADLLAVESNGRLVVIEVKLAQNNEARRAVVSQILTYAAFLFGLSVRQLEDDVLARHLHDRECTSIADVVKGDAQQGDFSRDTFDAALKESLDTGLFRLVIVLDDAPDELMNLVGYLEEVTNLTIDLVTVSRYDVNGSTLLIPQRVEPARRAPSEFATAAGTSTAGGNGTLVTGADDFLATISKAPAANQPLLRKLTEWAISLEQEGLVKLSTYHGKNGSLVTLLPRLKAENVGLVTIWNDKNTAYLQFWRSVFERRAPQSLDRVNQALGQIDVGQGNTVDTASDELLAALTVAYREAAMGRISE